MSITYSKTTLKIKRFDRVVETSEVLHGLGMNEALGGNWIVKYNTVILNFKLKREEYLINQSIPQRIYIKLIPSGQGGFSKTE